MFAVGFIKYQLFPYIMRIKYHEPLGDPDNQQDPLPENWQELSAIADGSPRKFGVVEQEKLYRSGIVWPHQVGGLHHDYGIRHIVTLIDGDWLQQFDDDERITFVV